MAYRVSRSGVIAAAAAVVVAGAQPAAQAPASPAAVQALVDLMASHKITAAAAEDPAHPGSFVAVLHIPGVQLLAVRGHCAAEQALRETLARKAYNDLYGDINACAEKAGKLFIQDMGADGLRLESRGGQAFDIAYVEVDQQTFFNGDWKAQKLDEKTYRERFEAIDREYAALLNAIAARLKAAP